MRALLIIHWKDTDIDLILRLAEERQIDITIRNPSAGDALPNEDQFDIVICMGGPQTAAGEIEDYLHHEIRFLRSAVAARKPVLGICLGSQLIARALGGRATVGKAGVEAGFIDVLPVKETTGAWEVSGRYFSFHSDSFEIPPEATLLAHSDKYPQAWSLGSALCLQFHPELSLTGIAQILEIEEEKLKRSNVDVENTRAEAEEYASLAVHPGRDLLEGWFDRLTITPRSQPVTAP